MQKQRLHPNLNQHSRLQAGDNLLSKILHKHEFGSKSACSWGEEGDICPAYRTLWERPPTRDTELIGCVAHEPAALPAACTVFHPWVDTDTYKVIVSPHTVTQITL